MRDIENVRQLCFCGFVIVNEKFVHVFIGALTKSYAAGPETEELSCNGEPNYPLFVLTLSRCFPLNAMLIMIMIVITLYLQHTA